RLLLNTGLYQLPILSALCVERALIDARLSGDGRFLVTASGSPDEPGSGAAKVWDTESGAVLADLPVPADRRLPRQVVRYVAISPRGDFVVAAVEREDDSGGPRPKRADAALVWKAPDRDGRPDWRSAALHQEVPVDAPVGAIAISGDGGHV